MKLLFTILLFVCAQTSFAVDYYLSATGGTGNGLTQGTAWNLATANATVIGAGDRLLIKRGDVFAGSLTPRGGTIGNPVIYTTYGTGANPIFSGFTTLSTWTLSSGSIWYATFDVPVLHGVTVNGLVKAMGRTPNTGWLTLESHNLNLSITDNELATTPSWTGAELVTRKLHWIMDRHTITNHAGTTLNYSTSNNENGNSGAYSPVVGNGYFFQDHLQTLDTEHEWFYDDAAVPKRLYLHTGVGSPADRVIKASTVATLISISGSYMQFNDIDFEGGNTAVVLSGSASNIAFNNCNFRNQGVQAIYGSPSTNNHTITGGSITGALNRGIYFEFNCNNITINGVTVNGSGMIDGAASSGDGSMIGLMVSGNGNTVVNSTVKNSGYNGIDFKGDNVLIKNNFVDSSCMRKADGSGIYTVITGSGITGTNRIIRSNIVLNSLGNAAGLADGAGGAVAAGIYLDDYTNNVIVDSNFVQGSGKFGGIFANGGHTNTITNNTLFDNPVGIRFNVYGSNGGTRLVRNMVVTGNEIIAKSPTQYALFVEQQLAESPSLWGTINNNIYARPIAQTTVVGWYQWNYAGASNTTTNYTVAGWNTASGFDATTLPTAYTITNENQFKADYNATPAPVTIPLSGSFRSVKNILFQTSYSLPAYRGQVLMSSTDPVTGTIYYKAPSGKYIKTPSGKFLIKQL